MIEDIHLVSIIIQVTELKINAPYEQHIEKYRNLMKNIGIWIKI